MEHLDYSQILEKIGPEKDMSKLTEEEWLFYDMVRAVKTTGMGGLTATSNRSIRLGTAICRRRVCPPRGETQTGTPDPT